MTPPRHRPSCDKRPAPRVLYDKLASGYRAQVRCQCSVVCETSRRLHDHYAAAEVEARRLADRDQARITQVTASAQKGASI